MAGRRGNGEGYIRQRSDGRWEASLAWTDEDGVLRRQSFYGRTKKLASDKMKVARDRLNDGQPVKDATITVAAWLATWRETTLAVSNRKPTTRATTALLAKKHIEATPIGKIRLDKLRPTDVEAMIRRMRSQMKPGKGEGSELMRSYSDSTIRSVYGVLRAGLDGAVRDGLLAKNPAAAVQRPGVARQEVTHLEPGDVAAILAAASGSRYHLALVLIATTGLRRGEALAVRWRDVDLDAEVLRVTGTLSRVDKELIRTEPKTTRSRREVPLDSAVVSALRRHRITQKAERLRAGDQWQESGLVFTTELGKPVDPRNLLRVMEVAAKSAGHAGGVGVHTLRHAAAYAWLEQGIHLKAVSDMLGHSSIAITGDVYGHSSQDTARAAVTGLAGQLGLQ